jgi:hypothetical protein
MFQSPNQKSNPKHKLRLQGATNFLLPSDNKYSKPKINHINNPQKTAKTQTPPKNKIVSGNAGL